MNTTQELRKALTDIRDKSREIAIANNIPTPIKGWSWFDGGWGDESINLFYFEDYKA